MNAPKKRKFADALLRWWDSYGRRFPWRETRNPFQVLVSEILLHRTRAAQVVSVYSELMARYPGIAELAAATESEIDHVLHSLGLLWRTKLLRLAARAIVQKYGGTVPDNVEELKSLPGVSNYIASAVSCFAFGHPEVLLDTNTVRIVGRVFGEKITDGSRRSKHFEMLYRSLLDVRRAREFNYAMIDLGALICRPDDPACELCPVQIMCRYGTDKLARKSRV